MSKKGNALRRLCQKPTPKDFTKQELETLMKQCGCENRSGGRGSSIVFYHRASGRVLTFDGPHPGNELYHYQIKKVIKFLSEIGEI